MNFREYLENRKEELQGAVMRQVSRIEGTLSPLNFDKIQSALTAGKKIRGTLLCLVNDVTGGPREQAMMKAAAIELIHAASLIHDDYVDQHRTRRKMKAVWTLTGARNAVLLGDVIFASAIDAMSDMGREEGQLISRTIARVAGGALIESNDPDKMINDICADHWPADIYKRVIALKTGALFGAACQLGAIGDHNDKSRQQLWFTYGARIGEAYQIADDIHDLKDAIASDRILPETIISLAPPLLYFVEETRPLICSLLHESQVSIRNKNGFTQYLRLAVQRMESHIETMLPCPVSEESLFSETPFGALARQAPREILAMFT